jgi:flagellar motor switch protein FliG
MAEPTLSKAEKAALVVLYLERDTAHALLQQLDDNELRALKTAASKLKDPKIELVQAVVDEFMGELSRPVALKASGDRYVESLMIEAVGEERMRRVSGASSDRLKLLEDIDPKVSASLLEREHPQAVAAMLYCLDDQVAARIMKHMPEARVGDLVRRIGSLVSVPTEALKQLEAQFARALGDRKDDSQKKPNGVSKAATLLNALDKDTAGRAVDAIAGRDKDLADKIKSARFTVDDLAAADARGLQLVLREVESDKLLLALKTASDSVREKLLSCVSSRVADSLREELGNLGPVRIKDVEAAQKSIVDVALRLQTEGKLMLASKGGEDFV